MKGSKDNLSKIILLISKTNDLTLRRLERNIRRVRYKIFKKNNKKYVGERLDVKAIDISTITKKIHVAADDKNYCYSKPQYFYEDKKLEFCAWSFAEPIILNNVFVIGSSNFVILNNKSAIYELYFFNKDNNFSYSDRSFISEKEGIFTISYNKSGNTIKTAINFCGSFSYNYYHFLFEIVSKFYYLENNCIPKEIPIIVDEVIANTRQYREILDFFNKDNRSILYVKNGEQYNVEELYFLPTINFIPPDYADLSKISYRDCVFNIESIKFIKQNLISKKSDRSFGKKIFISRKNASSRRKYNENEVVTLFLKHGFEICYPENLSISEQISLFSGAEFVAGVTGAAFTNLIFCSEGCKALCLMSYPLDLSIFSTIAKILGVDLQYHTANDTNIGLNKLHAEFMLDIDKLDKALISFIDDSFAY